MALDFEALKRKLEESENRGGGDFSFWRPKDGRNEIRVLPAHDGGNDFYVEVGTRWNVGPDKKKLFVPVDRDEPCPVREFVDKLNKSDDEDDTKLAKSMRYSGRYLFNVLDMSLGPADDNYGKVLVYEAPVTVFKQIIEYIVDPDYHDLIDPEKGYNIVVERKGTGLKTEYSVRPRKDPSPITVKDWKENMPDLMKLATPKSYADRLAILKGESTSGGSSEGGNANEVRDNIQSQVSQQSQQQPIPEEPNPWANEATPPEPNVPEPTPEPQQPAQDPAPQSNSDSSGDSIQAEIEALLNRKK